MISSPPTSLTRTIDAVSEAIFLGQPIPDDLRVDILALLIYRQIQTGSNSGFFHPLTPESGFPSRLFTGEQLHTQLARRHIQLIEAARLLRLLSRDDLSAANPIKLAELRMDTMCYSKFCATGECKSISIAYMRYLATCAQNDEPDRLSHFLAHLAAHRDGKGAWRGFPYFYTLLALTEIASSISGDEIQYAVGSFENRLARFHSIEAYTMRRQSILLKTLTRS
jgi:hypothetical protein